MKLDKELLKKIISKIEMEEFPMDISENNSKEYLADFSIKKLDYYSSNKTRSEYDVFLYHINYLSEYGFIKGLEITKLASGNCVLSCSSEIELTDTGHEMAEKNHKIDIFVA